MENKEKDFNYSYYAPTKVEAKIVGDIKKKYLDVDKKDSDVERLKKLDKKVSSIPAIYSISLGVVGILIFGLGLSMVLEFNQIIWGTIVSAIGIIPMIFAYPLYKVIYKNLKNKYRDEILMLSDKILHNKEINND